MQVVVTFTVFSYDLPTAQFQELCRRFPAYVSCGQFKMDRVRAEDPSIQGVCELLRAWDLMIVGPEDNPRYEENHRRVWLFRERDYDDAELDACELLEPVVPRSAWAKGGWFILRGQAGEPSRVGERFIEKRTIPKGVHIVGFDNGGMCCLDSVVKQLETQNFTGLQFLPLPVARKIAFSDDFEEVPPGGPPWWYVSASVRMPSCVPPNYTSHFGKRVLPREFPQGTPCEPGFTDCERHYARSEIAALGAFDVARNGENPNMDSTTVILSNRFYRFCRERKFHVGFRPVRIHEGE